MKRLSVTFLLFIANLVCGVLLSGCAYRLSNKVDNLPGGVKRIQIPVFKNVSPEPGVEVFFTESMKSEVLRSGYASIADSESESDAVLEGTIISVLIDSDSSVIEAKSTSYLPTDTVLSTKVNLTVAVSLVLRRKLTREILWSSEFSQAKEYTPPQLTLPTLNTANNLYNVSAKRQTLTSLSSEMMQLAFDRLVDNF